MHLTSNSRVVSLLKMLTYITYAALFRRLTPCSRKRSDFLKPLLQTYFKNNIIEDEEEYEDECCVTFFLLVLVVVLVLVYCSSNASNESIS
jgi:hypothetical protein